MTSMRSERSASPSKTKLGLWIFRIACFALIIFIILLNVQPWREVGAQAVAELDGVPFVGIIFSIPIIRSIAQSIANNAADVIAILLWFFVQLSQMLKMASESPEVSSAIKKLFGVNVDRIPQDEFLKKLCGWSYILEFVVCSIRYPIYGNEAMDIFRDFGMWATYNLNLDQIILFLVTMLAFEGGIWLSAKLHNVMFGSK